MPVSIACQLARDGRVVLVDFGGVGLLEELIGHPSGRRFGV
ncbi:hypothetical protein U8D41_001665 [Mycobacterium shigaense]|nr:hypothetical protein [Mycobacterium shigaense]MEA1124150.1 hypothetical protein [Mycobacterium shigaense]